MGWDGALEEQQQRNRRSLPFGIGSLRGVALWPRACWCRSRAESACPGERGRAERLGGLRRHPGAWIRCRARRLRECRVSRAGPVLDRGWKWPLALLGVSALVVLDLGIERGGIG